MRENTGTILNCSRHSKECGYRCCDQEIPTSTSVCRESMILLFPGEWEHTKLSTTHLITTELQADGGRLAVCDRINFDQSKCNSSSNFKPLDCQSYPFSPVLVDHKLRLALDMNRCPLSRNIRDLQPHYKKVHSYWEQLIINSPIIYNWVANMPCFPGYQIIET